MNRGRIEQLGTAEEIYYRSRTDFVATFIGLANVFDAEVVGEAGGLVRVRANGIGEVLARADPLEKPQGRSVRLYVRPESIELTRSPPHGANVLRGHIARRSFVGAQIDFVIDIDGVPLRVITRSDGAPQQVNEETLVSFNPSSCLVLASA